MTGTTVETATVKNPELLPDLIGAKKPRMDINCTFNDGKFHHRAMMRLDGGKVFSDRLQIRFYNLKVSEYKTLDKVPEDLKRAVFWCKFISGKTTDENFIRFVKLNGMNKELEMAEKAYGEITVTEEERAWAYHLSMDRAEVDYWNGLRRREEKGVEKGKLKAAQNLLKMKLGTHKQIAEAVDLPLKRIDKLARELSAKAKQS